MVGQCLYFMEKKLYFPVVSAKDTHFTKTLISKVGSKLSMVFEQHKSNPSSLSWVNPQPLRSSAGHQWAEESHCAPNHFPCLPSQTNAGKQYEILELVRHEPSYRSLKNKMPGCMQVSLFFVLLFSFLILPIPGVSTWHHSSIKTVIKALKNIHISRSHTPISLSCEYHKYHAHNRWKWHKQQILHYSWTIVSFSLGSMLLKNMYTWVHVLC